MFCHLRAAVWGEPVAEQIKTVQRERGAGASTLHKDWAVGFDSWPIRITLAVVGLIWTCVTQPWPLISFKIETEWTHLPFWNIYKIPHSPQVRRFTSETTASSGLKVTLLHTRHGAELRQRFDNIPVKSTRTTGCGWLSYFSVSVEENKSVVWIATPPVNPSAQWQVEIMWL